MSFSKWISNFSQWQMVSQTLMCAFRKGTTSECGLACCVHPHSCVLEETASSKGWPVLTNSSWLLSEIELSKLSYKDEIQFLLLCLWMFLQARWSMLKNTAKTRKLLYLSEFFSLWISDSSRPACSTKTSRGFQDYIKILSQTNNNQTNI